MKSRRESAESMFRFKGALWEPFYRTVVDIGDKRLSINGPYCLDCRVSISFPHTNANEGQCPNCEKRYKLERGHEDLRGLAHIVYEGKLREGFEVISLDLPPSLIQSRDENENYWVEARLGQKDGKLMAVIYFGDKNSGTEGKKAYSQAFLDFDDEHMRFDKANKNPLEIIARLKAEFINSVHISEKRGIK